MDIPDEGETLGLFEPLMVSEDAPARAGLNDLALELAERSAAFRSGLPSSIAGALADLVRVLNCHYSNLDTSGNWAGSTGIGMIPCA